MNQTQCSLNGPECGPTERKQKPKRELRPCSDCKPKYIFSEFPFPEYAFQTVCHVTCSATHSDDIRSVESMLLLAEWD